MNDPDAWTRSGPTAALRDARVTRMPEQSTTSGGYRAAARVAEVYERGGQLIPAAVNYAAAAIAAAQSEQVAESLEIAVRALVAFAGETVRDPTDEARMASMLGALCHQFFDYERALRFYELALSNLLASGDEYRWSSAMRDIADVILVQARQEPAGADPRRRERLLSQAEELARRLIADGVPATSRAVDGPRLLAGVLCERGRPADAWAALRGTRQGDGAASAAHGQEGSLRLASGRCLQLLGRLSESLVELDAALEALDPDRSLAERMFALQLRSSVREQTGDLMGALADARTLAAHAWGRHQRQAGGFMDQVWSRAGAESQRRDLEARAKDLIRTAEQDPLTGLANRRAIEGFCAQLPLHEQVCLVLVDVDNFKGVNDRFGHAVGDDVLREVGNLLTRAVRSVDRVARWGGEEFLIALPGGSGTLGADAAARVCRRVEGHAWSSVAADLKLTVSAGVACGPANQVEAVLLRADAAMYAAKNAGRNRAVSS
jgi:diguanylate cyclase (GGDEF)-like protein